MKKAAIYIRVSTLEQAEEGYSVGVQTERLKAYCKAKDWAIYDTYTDAGFSGANIERPALSKLITDIKNNKVDTVAIYKLDRLSRSQKDTLYLIEDVFLENGVDFVSMNENFDTSTPFGRAMIGLLSVFAQLEREQIRERFMMGREARAKAGYWHGGGYDPIGYDYVDNELIINEYEAMQIRKIHDLFQKHTPISRIRKMMNAKYTNRYGGWAHDSAVHNALKQPIYTGKIEWNGEVYDGQHEPIIDEETFKKTQRRYKEISWNKGDGKNKKRPFQAKHVLTGLLYCANCGARYFAKGNYSGRGENRYYRPYYTCYSRAKSAKNMIRDPNCRNKSYATVVLDEMITNEIKKLSFDPDAIKEMKNRHDPEVVPDNTVIENEITKISNQINRLLDLYQLGSVPFEELEERISELNQQKSILTNEIIEVVEEEPELKFDEAAELLEAASDTLDNGNLKEKRMLVHSLINEIIIDEEDINIYWAFA